MVQIPIPYRPDAGPAEPSPEPVPYGPADHAADQDAAKRADVALVSQVNPLLDDASADPDQVLQKLAQAHEAAAQGLRPSARAMFDVVAGQRLAGWRKDISALAQRRQAVADEAISEARQQTAAGEFARHALDDPDRACADLLTVASEARTRAERQGADPQAVARAGARARGEAVVGAVKATLARDPETALRLFDSHRELIDPESADVLHPLVRQETARQTRSRRIDDLIAAARPNLPQGLGDLLPPDAHPPLDPQAIAAEAMRRAGDDPEQQRAMALDVHARVAKINAQRAAACRTATARGQDCLADPDIASLDDLPAGLRLTLPATTRQGLETFYASGGHPPVSDPQAYADLHARMLADPAAFNDLDLTPYAAHLDRADFARLRQDQQTLRQGGPAARAIRDGVGQVAAKAASALAEIGITAAADPTRLAQVTASALTAAQDVRDAQNGKPLTEQQADEAVDRAVMGGDWNWKARLNLTGPLNSAGLPVNHFEGADGGLPADRRQPAPVADASAAPGQPNGTGHGVDMRVGHHVEQAPPPAVRRADAMEQALQATGLDKILPALGVPTAYEQDAARFNDRMKALLAGKPLEPKALETFRSHAAEVEADRAASRRGALTSSQIRAIMPAAGHKADELLDAINRSMAANHITTPEQKAAFLAQVAVESEDFQKFEESLYYTHVSGVLANFARFNKDAAAATPYLRDPQKLAIYGYEGKNKNIVGTDDGWRYRGRGAIQVTGRGNYRAIGFENNPDALLEPDNGVEGSARWWVLQGLDRRTASRLDRRGFDGVTRTVNGPKMLKKDLRWQIYQRALQVLAPPGGPGRKAP